jgi:nucleotide-binding universal stress UspA family protein
VFEHIVTIVDGSPTSSYAIGASITISKEIGSTISFCLTLDPMLSQSETGMMPFAELAYDLKARMLAAAIAQATAAGIASTAGSIVNGEPVAAILATANADRADLIMMGLAPRIGILRPFMRNLAEGVLAQTTIPLCIVRRPTRGILTHRILVPIAGDELGRIAIDEAIRIAQQFKSTLVFCSLAAPGNRRPASDAVAAGARAAAERGVPSETLVLGESGSVSTAIVRNVDLHGCDVIVMASHVRQGLPRIIEGSVTQAVIEQSDVPVVVVRRSGLA